MGKFFPLSMQISHTLQISGSNILDKMDNSDRRSLWVDTTTLTAYNREKRCYRELSSVLTESSRDPTAPTISLNNSLN